MACALTEPGNYPDYIKNMLKGINVGNDTDLKNCACSLRTPLTDEGCPVIDKDGKVGVFRACIYKNLECYGSEFDYPCPANWTLKNAMDIHWRIKTIQVQVSMTGKRLKTGGNDPTYDPPETFSQTYTLNRCVFISIENDGVPITKLLTKKEELVCPHVFYKFISILNEPGDPDQRRVDCVMNVGNIYDGINQIDNFYDAGFSFFAEFGPLNNEDISASCRINTDIFDISPYYGSIISATVLGSSTPVQFVAYFNHDHYKFISANVSITPTEWWS